MKTSTKTEGKNPYQTTLFCSIKNKALLRVAVIYYNFYFDTSTGPLKAVKMRLLEKKLSITNAAIAFEMTPSDVMPFLGCSKRTAQECIDLLRLLMI